MIESGNIKIVEANENFTKIDKSLIYNLDYKVVGIYCKVMVLGKSWNLNIKGLSSALNLSEKKIREVMSVLEAEGYMSRTAVKDERGRFGGWDYFFYAQPLGKEDRTEAGKRTSPKTDLTGNGLDQKRTTPKTDMAENGQENIYRLKQNIDLNNRETERKKEGRKPLTLPFSSLKFKETWETLRAMPKWKRKTQSALQMSLNKLSRYEEEFAVALMENAIAGEYQGVVFQDTDKRYQEWQRSRSSGSKPDDYPESNMAYMKRQMAELEAEWAREEEMEKGGIDEQ